MLSTFEDKSVVSSSAPLFSDVYSSGLSNLRKGLSRDGANSYRSIRKIHNSQLSERPILVNINTNYSQASRLIIDYKVCMDSTF